MSERSAFNDGRASSTPFPENLKVASAEAPAARSHSSISQMLASLPSGSFGNRTTPSSGRVGLQTAAAFSNAPPTIQRALSPQVLGHGGNVDQRPRLSDQRGQRLRDSDNYRPSRSPRALPRSPPRRRSRSAGSDRGRGYRDRRDNISPQYRRRSRSLPRGQRSDDRHRRDDSPILDEGRSRSSSGGGRRRDHRVDKRRSRSANRGNRGHDDRNSRNDLQGREEHRMRSRNRGSYNDDHRDRRPTESGRSFQQDRVSDSALRGQASPGWSRRDSNRSPQHPPRREDIATGNRLSSGFGQYPRREGPPPPSRRERSPLRRSSRPQSQRQHHQGLRCSRSRSPGLRREPERDSRPEPRWGRNYGTTDTRGGSDRDDRGRSHRVAPSGSSTSRTGNAADRSSAQQDREITRGRDRSSRASDPTIQGNRGNVSEVNPQSAPDMTNGQSESLARVSQDATSDSLERDDRVPDAVGSTAGQTAGHTNNVPQSNSQDGNASAVTPLPNGGNGSSTPPPPQAPTPPTSQDSTSGSLDFTPDAPVLPIDVKALASAGLISQKGQDREKLKLKQAAEREQERELFKEKDAEDADLHLFRSQFPDEEDFFLTTAALQNRKDRKNGRPLTFTVKSLIVQFATIKELDEAEKRKDDLKKLSKTKSLQKVNKGNKVQKTGPAKKKATGTTTKKPWNPDSESEADLEAAIRSNAPSKRVAKGRAAKKVKRDIVGKGKASAAVADLSSTKELQSKDPASSMDVDLDNGSELSSIGESALEQLQREVFTSPMEVKSTGNTQVGFVMSAQEQSEAQEEGSAMDVDSEAGSLFGGSEAAGGADNTAGQSESKQSEDDSDEDEPEPELSAADAAIMDENCLDPEYDGREASDGEDEEDEEDEEVMDAVGLVEDDAEIIEEGAKVIQQNIVQQHQVEEPVAPMSAREIDINFGGIGQANSDVFNIKPIQRKRAHDSTLKGFAVHQDSDDDSAMQVEEPSPRHWKSLKGESGAPIGLLTDNKSKANQAFKAQSEATKIAQQPKFKYRDPITKLNVVEALYGQIGRKKLEVHARVGTKIPSLYDLSKRNLSIILLDKGQNPDLFYPHPYFRSLREIYGSGILFPHDIHPAYRFMIWYAYGVNRPFILIDRDLLDDVSHKDIARSMALHVDQEFDMKPNARPVAWFPATHPLQVYVKDLTDCESAEHLLRAFEESDFYRNPLITAVELERYTHAEDKIYYKFGLDSEETWDKLSTWLPTIEYNGANAQHTADGGIIFTTSRYSEDFEPMEWHPAEAAM